MHRLDDPLGEIGLNSPTKKPSISLSTQTHYNSIRTGKENYCVTESINSNYTVTLASQLTKLSRGLKDDHKDNIEVSKLHDTMESIYSLLIQKHSVSQIKQVTKQHLIMINKLIASEHLDSVQLEILSLFNHTNPQKVENINELLLSDYTFCNEFYLYTLKILTLQWIIKCKLTKTYEDTILLLFSQDQRFLLKSDKLKIHLLLKIILNFFTLLPDYKLLFGFKILQYCSHYNLKFCDYINNMDKDTFEKQLLIYAKKNTLYYKYFNSFYGQLTKYTNMSKIMHIDQFLSRTSMEVSCINNVRQFIDELKANPGIYLLMPSGLTNFFHNAQEVLKSEQFTPINRLKLLTLCYQFLYLNNIDSSNLLLHFIDNSLIFLNSNLKSLINQSDMVYDCLKQISEISISKSEYKRISNVATVLFNASVIFSKFECIMLATKLELKRWLIENDTSYLHHLTKKLGKFISTVLKPDQKLNIFFSVYNFHVMSKMEQFSSLLEVCQDLAQFCLPHIKKFLPFRYSDCSEVLYAILYSNDRNIPYPNDFSDISFLLYSCLSGQMNYPIKKTSFKTEKDSYLAQVDLLLKLTYHLNNEMSTHSTYNLSQIVKNYSSKWISNIKDNKADISVLEIDFVKNLLHYLNFCNFHKAVLDLIENFHRRPLYFESILPTTEKYKLEALISLQLTSEISNSYQHIKDRNDQLETMKIDKLINRLELELSYFTWMNDIKSFDNLNDELLRYKPDIFDIKNDVKRSNSSYVKILLFNIFVLYCSSKLHKCNNNIVAAVTDAKKSLKLGLSLIRKQEQLFQSSRLSLIKYLSMTYQNIIEIYVHIGIAKDSEFFAKELSNVIVSLGEPTIVYGSLHFLHQYYCLTEQKHLKNMTLQKANKTFGYIDGQCDINSLMMYLFDNNETDKIAQSLDLFFGEMSSSSFLPDYWNLKIGLPVEDVKCLKEFRPLNSINKMNKMYKQVLTQLEADPFFKGLFESSLASPSCPNVINNRSTSNVLSHLSNSYPLSESPRSSNMTPKSKHIKQRFDRTVAISNLVRIIKFVKNLNPISIPYSELSKAMSLLSLSHVMLSSISDSYLNRNEDIILTSFFLDFKKSMPLYYDRMLNSLNREIYDNMTPISTKTFTHELEAEKKSIFEAQNDIEKLEGAFDVITIDICPITGNLILSKLENKTKRRILFTLPLNCTNFREFNSEGMPFEEIRRELDNIISDNNKSTSIEVTNSVTTAEGRKEWWQNRYSLDKSLETLLRNIENYWFNGFKGFFNSSTIDEQAFKEFKVLFYEILHECLPSRKHTGRPMEFLHIEDWIIEMFLKIDIQDSNLISMIEDLIYFILDILLYHGEENAYDEIDIPVIHVRLLDSIKKYHTRAERQVNNNHTFLIVSSSCHSIPWESLSFLRNQSITRVPSIKCLNDLLHRYNSSFPLRISIKDKISMILNPHGDLKRTESTFKDLFQEIAENIPHSKLIMNSKPTEEDFLEMLTNSNLFLYVGHGSGEQYARLKEIKKINSGPASFLLGCSSAAMKYYGRLEPSCSVYSYLLAGSPLVLGNLWDVTDKDIDKFSKSVFEKIGLIKTLEGEISGYNTVSNSVKASREVCHLTYLNGAAPVIYGLPVEFI